MKIVCWEYKDGLYKQMAYNLRELLRYYEDFKPNLYYIKLFVVKRIAKEQYNFIKKHTPSFLQYSTMLDVGCGVGGLLREFKRNGFKTYGVDYSTENIKISSRYGIVSSPNNLNPDWKFDIITLSHVLEHQVNPVEFVKSLLSKLNPNGVLFIETPNCPYLTDGFTNEFLTKRLNAFYSHLYEFTPMGMMGTIKKAGGEIVYMDRVIFDCPDRGDIGAQTILLGCGNANLNRLPQIIMSFVDLTWLLFKSLFTKTLQVGIDTAGKKYVYGDHIRVIVKWAS